jgi:hypothetical protein
MNSGEEVYSKLDITVDLLEMKKIDKVEQNSF